MDMNETHRPSKIQALLFFFLMLLLAGGVFVWHFYINKGTVHFSADAPFTVLMGTKTIECPVTPCIVKLQPASYEATFQKEGYFDVQQRVTVPFMRTIMTSTLFTFKPTLRELPDVSLPLRPIATAPLRPPYLQPDKEWTDGGLAALIKSAKRTVVSPIKDKTLFLEVGKALYIYTEGKTLQTTIPANGLADWMGEKIAYVTTTGSTQTLMTASADGKDMRAVVKFERPFKNLKLFGDLKGQYVLLQEENEGTKSYYLVDTYKKTRTRMEVDSQLSFAHWTGEAMVFEKSTATGTVTDVTIINATTGRVSATDAINGSSVILKRSYLYYVITKQQDDTSEHAVGISIEQALKDAQAVGGIATKPEAQLKKVFLSEYDSANNRYKTLLEIPLASGEHVSNLTASGKDATLLYFEKGGRVWEIKVGE